MDQTQRHQLYLDQLNNDGYRLMHIPEDMRTYELCMVP